MQRLIGFLLMASVKTVSHLFYRLEVRWLNTPPADPWEKLRLVVFLNHTSLFEPLFLQSLSYSFLWQLSARINVPGADITLNRPVVGKFWKMMVPNIVSVTRKKDSSWAGYLASIKPGSIVIMAPEGRMKRPNGLDKHGKPMTVRGGVVDIIENLEDGGIILAFSGGLHHVQSPGQRLPRVFKTIRLNFTHLDIQEYKASFPGQSKERKIRMVQDLQARLERDCPHMP